MSLIEERLDGNGFSRTEKTSVRISQKTLDDLLKQGAERENGFLRVPVNLLSAYDLLPPPPASAYPSTGVLTYQTYQITEVHERVLGLDLQHGRVTGSYQTFYELALFQDAH